ncbi:MAG: type II toxin-antitoxin system RelE/ParE family toxin [Acidobacteriaceae bacterium]
MSYTVVFTPEAEAQLVDLYVYIAIAAEASPAVGARFTDGIVTYCESLSTFPARGTRRDDIRPVYVSPAIESALPSPSM